MALNTFLEVGLIIILAAIVAGVMQALKQPLIIGYILTGIFVSPYFLNLSESTSIISTFSHIGISLLLFIVGLNLNLKILKDVGKVSIMTGIGQVLFTSIVGFFISKMLGFSSLTSIYLSIGLAFSSTIIIMKLLSDKGDVDTLYGRISIGFLIVQDLIVIFMLLFISSSNNGDSILNILSHSITVIIILSLIVFGFYHFIIKNAMKYIAKTQEYLMLFSIAWCFFVALLFNHFKFSIEFGALLAGISLASSQYKFEISTKLKPLRDFFLALFFVMLGANMEFSYVNQYITEIVVLSLFVIIGNPIIVMTLMGLMGYTKRSSFLAGLTVAQISEFSLILISLGISLGHIPAEITSMITAIALFTITGSSYMITYSNKIYPKISKYLSIFEKKDGKIDEHRHQKTEDHEICLFGYNRIGFELLTSLKKIKKEFLVIDYDPDTITNLAKEGYDCRYGDANDSEMMDELKIHKLKMVISTIPDTDTNIFIIDKIRRVNKNCIIIIMSHHIDDALVLYEQGASYVILPHFLGGNHVSTMIENYGLNIENFLEEKIMHLDFLHKRRHGKHAHIKAHE
ncbi:sodium:proton exchanger [archaeon D22]|nr:sodium:proton exchanger [archaeon D22]